MYHVYIIECRDHTLYTGITNDIPRRIKVHNSGKGGRYTKYRCPVKLIHSEDLPNKPEALKREAAIKRLTRAKKIEFIKSRSKNRDCPRRGLSLFF